MADGKRPVTVYELLAPTGAEPTPFLAWVPDEELVHELIRRRLANPPRPVPELNDD